MSDITEQRFVMGGHSPETDSELHKFPVLNDEEELIEMSEEFSLEEFQVVRREFFAHTREPAVTFNNRKFYVNSACLSKFPKILSGQYKIAHKHVMEMAELTPEDLRRINRKIERNPAQFMQYKATRPPVQGKYETAAGDTPTGPSVKDMPEFDPDAEISSLTLTIPSWKSSIERAKNTADLAIVSPQAKDNLVQALHELRKTIADLLSEMEDM